MKRTLLIVITLLLSGTMATAQPTERAWLALGDSYSSGEGIEDTPPAYSSTQGRDCRRAEGPRQKPQAWASVAFDQARVRLGLSSQIFVACTGAIADEVPAQLLEAKQKTNRDSWDLISFSFGGNNIKFSDVVSGCVLPSVKSWLKRRTGCTVTEEQLRRRVDMLVGKSRIDSEQYKGTMTMPNLLDLLSAKVTSGGDVLVLGYPNLIEDPGRWSSGHKRFRNCSGIQLHDVPMLRRVAGYLNSSLAEAVRAADQRHQASGVRFHFLDISQNPYESGDRAEDRHGRCTDDPWLNGLEFDAEKPPKIFYKNRSFHPHQQGHAATGRVVASYMAENVRLDDAVTRPVPSGVIEAKFLGNWRTPGWISQVPLLETSYRAEVSLTGGPVGTVVGRDLYPELGCGGPLTLLEATVDRVVLRENIDIDPQGRCVKETVFTLMEAAQGGLHMRGAGTGQFANVVFSGILARQ